MTEAFEILDVVDDADGVIGQAPRTEVHRRRLKHRAVHVLVFNEQGAVFVQKRAATKDTFPDRFDSSASGHLNSGEDYDQCAARELQEELGLTIAPEQLCKQMRVAACPETGCEFVWVYSLQGAYQPVINPAELADGRYWSVPALADLLVCHPEQCAPSFIRVVREFQHRNLWPGPMVG